MKKVAITGAGIAGLAMAIELRRLGFDVDLFEKAACSRSDGHGFLIHPDAVAILKSIIGEKSDTSLSGSFINRLVLKNNQNQLLEETSLNNWICMKRADAITALERKLPKEIIHHNAVFSHLISEDEKIKAIAFKNGQEVNADWFIGADGAHSQVRTALFGPTEYTTVLVKEILGATVNEKLFNQCKNTFTKYLHRANGISFGIIPNQDNELIWFIQFDSIKYQIDYDSSVDKSSFCKELMEDFPGWIQEIFDNPDTRTEYVWSTTDFDLLNAFHKQNVVLIGDAAHLALPFTSAGVANALQDVKCLISMLEKENNLENIFKNYYIRRAPEVLEHTITGRRIRTGFLEGSDKQVVLPMVF